MLELRSLNDSDIPLIETWLNKEHVKRWYEIPDLGITIDDWMAEIKEYKGKFQWITYLIVMWDRSPIGLCLYYKCEDSDGEEFGTLPLTGSYGIDYLIGEKYYLGKGLGKGTITMLINKIFSFPDALRVTADIDKDNSASKNALLSCGFRLLEKERSRYVIYNGAVREKDNL
ncbi:MAG: GNAT family N-acetyltransferase [Oscillospiraceae bacterium]|nr:GNAT family N-acetyltransferase [Oscillospiraceae bacterium]